MKQVTMESVKERIARIEDGVEAGAVLGLRHEFELACLRELVAVTEQRDAVVAESTLQGKFVAECFRAAASGGAMDGADIQELGERLGLFGREIYQPVLHGYICGHEAGEDTVYVIMRNPATAGQLAALRAEGVEWIEGSEPEQFGRYWVRYETDVGPYYCSAKWMEYNACASSNTNINKIWLADHSRSINPLRGVTHYTRLPEPIEGGSW